MGPFENKIDLSYQSHKKRPYDGLLGDEDVGKTDMAYIISFYDFGLIRFSIMSIIVLDDQDLISKQSNHVQVFPGVICNQAGKL